MRPQPSFPLLQCLSVFGTQIRLFSLDASQLSQKLKSGRNSIHWFSIINSPTEEAYAERLLHFEQKYLSEYLKEVGYIKSTWLTPFKEKLVKAWVDQSTHFGNTATSRVEGIHALLKAYIKGSTFDLFDTWKATKIALLNQLSELQSNQAKQHWAIWYFIWGCPGLGIAWGFKEGRGATKVTH